MALAENQGSILNTHMAASNPPTITPVPGDLIHSSDLCGCWIHMWHLQTYVHSIHTHKIKIKKPFQVRNNNRTLKDQYKEIHFRPLHISPWRCSAHLHLHNHVKILSTGSLPIILFLSCCYDKIPWQKQLREERAYFSLQLKDTVHHSRKVKVPGTGNSCSSHIHNQEAESKETMHCLLYTDRDPSPGNSGMHF